ncbi:MAG: hypothetical protein K8R87_12010 [Verrucomicrobia bacterium]|nr:hypothetical protein [Verrucomicrobiota bacterium]
MTGWIALQSIVLQTEVRSEKADRFLALPQWEERDHLDSLGAGLWPDDFNPALIIHPAMLSKGENDAAQVADDSWLRFLPRSLFSNRKAHETIEPALVDISAEALRAGENAPGNTRVIDPQGILGEAQTEDLTRFLVFHSENANVEARFFLLDVGQQLPPGVDLSQIASGEIARGSGCLVVYPLGAPQRARLFLSQNVTRCVEANYLETLAAACRLDAQKASDPVEQLQRFATQLSTRLFWLERAFPAVKPEPAVVVLPALEAHPQEPVPTLSEVSLTGSVQSVERFSFAVFRQRWLPWIGLGLTGALLVATIAIMFVRWLRRRRRQTVWILPDYDHRQPMRFGGPHCGACGATVKYG